MEKHRQRLSLDAEYHDGQVEAVEVGPRREVIITVRLDPVWNNGDDSTRRLHFSAIQNFEEVEAFFRPWASAARGVSHPDTVINIVFVSKGIIGIDLDRLGYVEIHKAKVRES